MTWPNQTPPYCVCICVCMYERVCVYVCICMHEFVCVHVCVCVCLNSLINQFFVTIVPERKAATKTQPFVLHSCRSPLSRFLCPLLHIAAPHQFSALQTPSLPPRHTFSLIPSSSSSPSSTPSFPRPPPFPLVPTSL